MPKTGIIVHSSGFVNPSKLVKQLGDFILKTVVAKLQTSFDSLSAKLTDKARRVIIESIKNSPEYKSITDRGDFTLRGELGLVHPESAFNELFRIWAESVRVEVQRIRKSGRYIVGAIKLYAIDTTFVDVLSSDAASFYSYNKGETTEIKWLDWLLTKGDRIIIRDYEINWAYPEKSRTGTAIMVPREIQKGWRVPPEYSGTITNNFVTRALDEAIPALQAEFNIFIGKKI